MPYPGDLRFIKCVSEKDIWLQVATRHLEWGITEALSLNTLRPRQNGCRFTDNVFKCIFLNENVWISLKISLKFVPKVPINNIPALVQILAWRRSGDKPLSEPMMVSILTHIYVTRPQWVNFSDEEIFYFAKILLGSLNHFHIWWV